MTIGIIAEGTRDYDIIENIVQEFYPNCICRLIQPDISAIDRSTYNGWEGVWQWCLSSQDIMNDLNKIPSHRIDLFVVHLDGDIIREKQVHCENSNDCPLEPVTSAAFCKKSSTLCPIEIQSEWLNTEIPYKVEFIKERIDAWLTADISPITVACVPFDSSESWIVAAFDKERYGSPEHIIKPADSIIGQQSSYHGYRVKRKDGKLKKAKSLYIDFLIPKLCMEWGNVKNLCPTAEAFQTDLERVMGLITKANDNA